MALDRTIIRLNASSIAADRRFGLDAREIPSGVSATDDFAKSLCDHGAGTERCDI
jgi:hypothetical protein